MSLVDDMWNLRSTLALLEGSNTKMLEYVKHKPRWRPPKGIQDESEDVMAFKQIYLSKAAGTYRNNLGKRVDNIFFSQVTAMREEDAAKEEQLQKMAVSATPDPFVRIYEQNNLSGDEIPDFLARTADTNISAEGEGADGSAEALFTSKARVGRKGNNKPSILLQRESSNFDIIRERINSRRNMNKTMRQSVSDENIMGDRSRKSSEGSNTSPGVPRSNSIAEQYMPSSHRRLPQSSQRKSSDHSVGLVGEVNDASIAQLDDQMSLGASSYGHMVVHQQWSNQREEDQERSIVSYSSRSQANAPQLGMYRLKNDLNG